MTSATDNRVIDMVQKLRAAEDEIIEATAESVLAAIKSAERLTLMPAEHLPMSGIVTMVHPKVYDRVRDRMATLTTRGSDD